QCAQVEAVKRFKAGFQTQIITLCPEQCIADVIAIMAETGYSTFPVTDTGVFHGKLLGIITDKDFDVRYDRTCRVAERMRTDVQVGVAIDDLKVANQLMITYGRGFLPVVSAEGTLLSVVFNSVAERSFPLPNLVEMLYQPRTESLLHRWGQLQHHLDKVQRLKDFKAAPSVHDNMRALGAQLLKGKRLTRLVGKAHPPLRVGKQMIETVAQHHRQHIKDDLTIPC